MQTLTSGQMALAELQALLDPVYAAAGHGHSGVYASASHSHAISDVTNLQSSLDAKAAAFGSSSDIACLSLTLGSVGPKLKSASGVVQARNNADDGFAGFRSSQIVVDTLAQGQAPDVCVGSTSFGFGNYQNTHVFFMVSATGVASYSSAGMTVPSGLGYGYTDSGSSIGANVVVSMLASGSTTTVEFNNGTPGILRDVSVRSTKYRSGASDPTTSDIPAGYVVEWLNVTSGELRTWANVAGTMRKSAAFT